MAFFRLKSALHLCAIGLLPVVLASNAWARSVVDKPATAGVANKPDAEVMLIEVYKQLGSNHLRAALERADALVAAYPTFRLGHLIRGDLLLMQTREVNALGPRDAPPDKLKNLRDEATVRLRSLRNRPAPEMVPRAIMQLRPDQKKVLVVDARHSRLYVYENRDGRLKLLTDYYVSQGKFGVNKLKAGDQKTPVGVYYITSRLDGSRLPDLYGAGALPINYPNDWDRLNGRSGSGIWLHGTPSETYSRPPLSSDGCVVLTNQDLNTLTASIEIGKTPVVIAEQLEFVSQAKATSDRAGAQKLVEVWRRDVESLDTQRVLAHYSNDFKSDRGENRAVWFARQGPVINTSKSVSVKLSDVTLFLYPGRDDLIVGTFTEEAKLGKTKNTSRRRQYWAREGQQWKIVSESVL